MFSAGGERREAAMGSLLIAIAANSTLVFSMKYAEKAETHRASVVLCNYIFGALLALILSGGFSAQAISGKTVWALVGLALVGACLMTACMLIQQRSLHSNGAGITTTYNRLGILIPTILSIFLFQEYPTVLKTCGIILAAAAVLYSYDKNADSRSKDYILLSLVLILGGFIDFVSKVFGILFLPESKGLYTFITFLICAVIMAVVVLVRKVPLCRKDVVYGALVGIPNAGITFGMIGAAAVLPAYIVFPVCSGAVILIVNIAGRLLFKEYLTRRETVSTVMIAAALVLLNV